MGLRAAGATQRVCFRRRHHSMPSATQAARRPDGDASVQPHLRSPRTRGSRQTGGHGNSYPRLFAPAINLARRTNPDPSTVQPAEDDALSKALDAGVDACDVGATGKVGCLLEDGTLLPAGSPAGMTT